MGKEKTDRTIDKQTERQTRIYPYHMRSMSRQTDKQRRQTDRHKNRQTDIKNISLPHEINESFLYGNFCCDIISKVDLQTNK